MRSFLHRVVRKDECPALRSRLCIRHVPSLSKRFSHFLLSDTPLFHPPSEMRMEMLSCDARHFHCPKNIPGIPRSPRGVEADPEDQRSQSYSILLPLNGGRDSLQKTPCLVHRPKRNQLNPISAGDELNFLSGDNVQRVPHLFRNWNRKVGRNSECRHRAENVVPEEFRDL